MSELLAWLRTLLDVPSVALDDERSFVSGYVFDHRAWVFIDDATLDGVRDTIAAVDDPQEVSVTPEVLYSVLPGEESSVGVYPARVVDWPGVRAVWAARRGPEIAFGECSVEEVSSALQSFESAVVVVPASPPNGGNLRDDD